MRTTLATIQNTKTSSHLIGAKVRRHSAPSAARAKPCYTVHQSNWTTTHHCECIILYFFFMQNGFLSFNLHSQFFYAKQENHNKSKFLFRD